MSPFWAKMLIFSATFLMYAIGSVISQNIIFTTAHLRVHSEYDADTTLLKRTVKEFSTNLSTRFNDDPTIRAKAIACSKILNYYIHNHRSVTDHHYTREKRGIPQIGELWSWISDSPSPSEWRSQRIITRDLVRLQNDQNSTNYFLKRGIIQTQKSVVLVNQKLKDYVSQIETNLEIDAKRDHLSNMVDTICYEGMLLGLELNQKSIEIEDITSSACTATASRYLFPHEKLHAIVEAHALKDKVYSPVFLSSAEIQQIYSLKATATMYDSKKKKIDAIIVLPLADYSLLMKARPMPDLNPFDQSRLHQIELLTLQKIDIILTSDQLKSMRLFSSSKLDTCQMHLESIRKDYICKSRNIQIFHQFDNIDTIESLPKAIIVEHDENTFYLDHPETVAKITCTNNGTSEVKIPAKLIKISIAEHCSLRTEFVSVSALSMENDTITTEINFEIFHVPNLIFNHTKLRSKYGDNVTMNLDNTDQKDHFNADLSKLNTDESNHEQNFETNHFLQFSISTSMSITVIVLACAATICLITFYKRKIAPLINELSDLRKVVNELEIQTSLGEARDRVQFERLKSVESLTENSELQKLENKLNDLDKKIHYQLKSLDFKRSNDKQSIEKLNLNVKNIDEKSRLLKESNESHLFKTEDLSEKIADLQLENAELKTLVQNEYTRIDAIVQLNTEKWTRLRKDLEKFETEKDTLLEKLGELDFEGKARDCNAKIEMVSSALETILAGFKKIEEDLVEKDDKVFTNATLHLTGCVKELSSKLETEKTTKSDESSS